MIRVARASAVALAIVGGFVALQYTFRPTDLIVLLNGLLVGSLVSVAVSYYRLIAYAALGIGEYTRARQFTLGVALSWIVIAIGAFTSIYVNVADLPTTAYVSVAFARYLAVIAAVLQVTSPDYGLGVLYGRDRKVLIACVVSGVIVATATIILQNVGV